MDLILLFSIVFFFFSLIANYLIRRDLMYPPVIHGAVWFMVIAIYSLSGDEFAPFSAASKFLFATGHLAFCCGSYLSTYNYKRRESFIAAGYVDGKSVLSWLVFAIAVIGFPLFILKATYIVESSQSIYQSFFRDLRHQLTQETAEDFGVLSYFALFSVFNLGVQMLIGINSRNRFRIISSIVLALAYGLFSTGRTTFFMILIMVNGILLITRKTSPGKSIVYGGSIGLLFFSFISILMGKGGSFEYSFSDNFIGILNAFKLYLLGSLPAFAEYMNGITEYDFGLNMFRTFFAVLHAAGADVKVVELVQDYVYVPMSTNVYTVYQPYYKDFWVFGAVVIQFLAGIWHGYLYKRADSGSLVYVLLYSIFLYPLVMQFFQDQYFNLLSTWIQMAFYLLVYLFIFKQLKIARTEGEAVQR